MTNIPKRPGGLPNTDKMKNGIVRESILKNIPHDRLQSKPQSNSNNKK